MSAMSDALVFIVLGGGVVVTIAVLHTARLLWMLRAGSQPLMSVKTLSLHRRLTIVVFAQVCETTVY